jgi:DNA-binding NarL/FixJ family response regulator
VLVVEDYEGFRRFIRLALQQWVELQIIGEVSDGLEAVEKAQALQPDLILLDIGLPKLNGLEACRRIRELSPNSKILFVSQEPSSDMVEQALSLGASGYVLKSRAQSDLRPAIEAVLRGEQFVSSALNFGDGATARALVGSLKQPPKRRVRSSPASLCAARDWLSRWRKVKDMLHFDSHNSVTR